MKRILGILGVLVVIYLLTWIFADVVTGRPGFMTAFNQENLLRRTALFGFLGIGVAFVIITGGIDLSIGSIVCLVGVGLPWFAVDLGWPLWIVLLMVFIVPIFLGWIHGMLITKLNLQPFIVTLCGLLIYRGITRGFTDDQSAGYRGTLQELKWFTNGKIPIFGEFGIPVPLVILAVVATLAILFLNRTVWGRYLQALGNNEEAAKFSGINTDRLKILAYMISAGLAGFGGILLSVDTQSAQPTDFGNVYELYAIAAAVLGGCSLKGGTGSIVGVLIGTAVLRLLYNTINMVPWLSNTIEYAVIGGVILVGVIADELAQRAYRAKQSQQA